MMKNFIFYIICFTLIICGGKAYSSELTSYDQLKESWNTYKTYFIQEDGRVLDFYNNNISTSEGQSYALLRSVWMNDRKLFDKVLEWTDNNLKVRGDNLCGWKWGENKDGKWQILDRHSATDAEQDFALALIMASKKWNDPKYLEKARGILKDMWKKEIIKIKNKNYVMPGDWGNKDKNIKINPSYLAPYAYKIFAEYDKENDWLSLVDTSYSLLKNTSNLSIFYLPPDWAYINTETGIVSIDKDICSKESDFSYDAIRTFWRVAMDYVLYEDKNALEYLKKSTKYLKRYWQLNESLPTTMTADGLIKKAEESYSIYGAVLPAIAIIEPKVAQEIYHKKLAADYIKGFWGNPRDYYAQNLIWFGIALWTNVDSKSKPLSKKGLDNLLKQ